MLLGYNIGEKIQFSNSLELGGFHYGVIKILSISILEYKLLISLRNPLEEMLLPICITTIQSPRSIWCNMMSSSMVMLSDAKCWHRQRRNRWENTTMKQYIMWNKLNITRTINHICMIKYIFRNVLPSDMEQNTFLSSMSNSSDISDNVHHARSGKI